MFENISGMILVLEKYPVFTTIVVAFISLIGIVVTQIIIHINAEYDKKKERITDYIGSLRLQVLCTHDRLALLRARRIETGMKDAKKNSIKYIDGREIKNYSDIQSDIATLEWCYHGGFNLCSVCYLLACLMAQCYRTKQHLEILHLNKGRLNKLTDYLLKIEGIFDKHFGIWQVMQYDIALTMIDDEEQIISFGDFCKAVKEKHCFVQLFNFYLSIADYGRRTQELDLIIVLYDFYYFLEGLAYPSVLKTLVYNLSMFFRKSLLFYIRKAGTQREIDRMENYAGKTNTEKMNSEKGKTEEAGQAEKTDLEKALELKTYLYTVYQENKEKKKKEKQSIKRKKFFMSYYDIAVQPISSYVAMEGLNERYIKQSKK